MVLLGAIALRLVSIPVSENYAYLMLAELVAETVALYAYIAVLSIRQYFERRNA